MEASDKKNRRMRHRNEQQHGHGPSISHTGRAQRCECIKVRGYIGFGAHCENTLSMLSMVSDILKIPLTAYQGTQEDRSWPLPD
jgi:hypothetical protein